MTRPTNKELWAIYHTGVDQSIRIPDSFHQVNSVLGIKYYRVWTALSDMNYLHRPTKMGLFVQKRLWLLFKAAIVVHRRQPILGILSDQFHLVDLEYVEERGRAALADLTAKELKRVLDVYTKVFEHASE